MKKIFFTVFFAVFFALYTNAIVIVPPAVYFVTLSIATFLSNVIIGLLALIAVSGIANKKFFGKKVSELFAYFFGWLKKITIAIFSMLLAVFLVKPIEIFSILEGAILALFVCFALFFISSYSKYRLIQKEQKTRLVFSAIIFSFVVSLLFGFSAFASIETKMILTKGVSGFYPYSPDSGFELNLPFADNLSKEAQAFNLPAGAPVGENDTLRQEVSQGEDKKRKLNKTFIDQELWFYPKTNAECKIAIGSQVFSFMPVYSCYLAEGGVSSRIFCPVLVSRVQINQQGSIDLIASGSCQAKQKIVVLENGFEVEN